MSKLTPEERAVLKASGIFDERPGGLCKDCGGYHIRACPRIKRQVWMGNGNRTEVEFWQHGQWDESAVIWTEDIYDSDGEPDE